MLRISLIAGVLLFGLAAFTANPVRRSEASQDPQEWLAEKYKEATSVKAGMSRAELLRVFDEDGGLQRIPASRYVLRSCRLIKVDVEFDVEYGQAYRVKSDKELKIKSISKPYLEYMNTD